MRRIGLLMLAWPMLALAQEAPAPAPSDEIVVTAIKGMWSLEGKRIRAAQAAFAAGRDRYAPGSRLSFQITLKNARAADDLRLTLRKGDDIIPVPLDGERRFELPPLDSDEWRLIANRTPAEIGARVWVLSPGTSEGDRRLGDLRLHCRVTWALIRDRFNFLQRAGFDAIGGCDSSRLMIYTNASRPIVSASITGPDGRPRALRTENDIRYHMPIADKSLPDASRIHLVYR